MPSYAFLLDRELDTATTGAKIRAMRKIGTICYLSTSLNTGHARGLGQTTVILPVRARDEEAQCTTQESKFSYVRLSDGGLVQFEGPRSEVEVLAEIAGRAVTTPINWEDLKLIWIMELLLLN